MPFKGLFDLNAEPLPIIIDILDAGVIGQDEIAEVPEALLLKPVRTPDAATLQIMNPPMPSSNLGAQQQQ